MQFITEELKARFAEIGDQSEKIDPIIVAKYNRVLSSTTWLMTEYDPEYETLHGYCLADPIDLKDAYGKESFSKVYLQLEKMEDLHKHSPVDGIMRDMTFEECKFSEIMNTLYKKTYKTLSDIGFTLNETPGQRHERFIKRLQEIQQMNILLDKDNELER